MWIKSKLFVAAAALVVAACAPGNVRLQTDYNRSSYDHRNFDLYHADRDTKVVIHGDPFGMEAEAFAKAVTGHMQGANPGRRTNFTTTPGKSAEKNLWVVMAFNSEVGIYELCRAKRFETRVSEGRLSLRAAWCWDGRQDSLVTARVGAPENVNDLRFRALIRETVLNLFPRHMDQEFLRDDSRRRRRR
jgi:hypothetical protein